MYFCGRYMNMYGLGQKANVTRDEPDGNDQDLSIT